MKPEDVIFFAIVAIVVLVGIWANREDQRQRQIREDQARRTKREQKSAQAIKGFEIGVRLYKEKHFDSAKEYFIRAADSSHSASLLYLGIMASNGQGMPQNNARAAEYLRKAIALGNAHAKEYLGRVLLLEGRVKERHRDEALFLLREAVESGELSGHVRKAAEMKIAEASRESLTFGMQKLGALSGQGALRCIAGVYVIANDADGKFKIGETGDFSKRFYQLQSQCRSSGIRDIRPVCLLPINEHRQIAERLAHSALRSHRVVGEWFKCDEEQAIRAAMDAVFNVHKQMG